MSIPNRRVTTTESYDPKQRIVGGIVLFLIMLLIYSLLKLLLGISSPPEGTYTLREPLPDEVNLNAPQTGSPSLTTSAYSGGRALPTGFVFLGIDGNPMLGDGSQLAEGELYEPSSVGEPLTGPYWIVQASSFKDGNRADRMVEQLRDKGFESEVHKIGDWYTVRLMPQGERGNAERQLRQLRTVMGIKGLIKKID